MADTDIDSRYTQICSSQTIYSNDKGFFGELYDGIKSDCRPNWIEKTFGTTESDLAKLKELYDDSCAGAALLGSLEHITPVYREKDAIFSHQRRNDGDQLAKQEDYVSALVLLTQAVLRAPTKGLDLRYDGGLSLAFALWSRSSVLLKLKHGAEALVDIQSAIDNGLEQVKKTPEYFKRLATAYALIGDKCKSDIALNLTKSLLNDSTKFNALKIEIEQVEVQPQVVDTQLPELCGGENKVIKGASRKMEIYSSAESGNYAVATEKLSAGDTLVVEQPIAACLLPKYFATHCHHCIKRIRVAYGCSRCAGIVFCSPKCATTACDTYHRFECKFTDLLIGSGMSILCFIALRMITQHDRVTDAIRENRLILQQLCSHSNRRQPEDYMQRSVMSAFLLSVLQKSGYFEHRTSESVYPNSSNEWDIADILVGLLQVLQFNAHEIFDSLIVDETTKSVVNDFIDRKANGKAKFVYIGVAIYNSAAYFNHSCYPALTRYFVGKTIVLRTSRPVLRGEMIAENYGPIFTRQTRSERQRNLRSRYWFLCECVACKENWHTMDNLNNNARLRCPTDGCSKIHKYPLKPSERIKCIGCNQLVDLQQQIDTLRQAENLYSEAAELIEVGRKSDAATLLFDGINLFYSVAIPPHRSTHIAQETLRVCLA